ncbi:MAG: FlhC family transcriptional regulator [Steroidobacteraceae bacterium]
MRITDDRYSRDRQRFDLALRFIRHEARTQTIRLWTGLTDDRIRKLYRAYVREEQRHKIRRHRGKSPQQVNYFLRSPQLRQEAAVLGSICALLGLIPATHSLTKAAPPGAVRGDLLVRAYEFYLALAPQPAIGFEHAVFLVNVLSRGEELQLARCRNCGAAGISDGFSLHRHNCSLCASVALKPAPAGAATLSDTRRVQHAKATAQQLLRRPLSRSPRRRA